MKSKVKVSYEYKNRESGSTKLWLAWPHSKLVEDLNTTRPPSRLTTIVDQEIANSIWRKGKVRSSPTRLESMQGIGLR